MQVPSTITVSNGHGDNQNSLHGFQRHGGALPMEIPDTLTGEFLLLSNCDLKLIYFFSKNNLCFKIK